MPMCAVADSPECAYLNVWTKCFSCREYVCRKCSKKVKKYYSYGRKRICNDCLLMHLQDISSGRIKLEEEPTP